jgi:tetratricopeptide (TPR) repeat protein
MRRRTVTDAGPISRRPAAAAALALAALVVVGPLTAASVCAAQETLSREATPVGQDQAVRLFHEANDLYARGDHAAAAELYQAILAGGFENAEVHYNLANSRYMLGEIAQAVLGYERALRLDGSHEDAAANLEFVREQLADRQVRVGGAVSEAVESVSRRADVGRLAVLTSLFYFIVIGCVVAGVLRGAFQPWLTRLTTVMLVHLLVAGAIFGYRLYRTNTVREAVVVATDVPVRTGPGDDFVLEFRLHEGTKVRLREARDDWARIYVEGTDLEGWLPGRTLEEI